MATPNPTAATLPVAGAPVAAGSGAPVGGVDPVAQMRATTVRQLRDLSVKLNELGPYLQPQDIQRLTQAVTEAGRTGSLEPSALVDAIGHAEARRYGAPQPYMDAMDAATDVMDALTAQEHAARDQAAASAATTGVLDQAKVQEMQAFTARKNQLSAAIKDTIKLLSSNPTAATAQLTQLTVLR